MQFTTFITHHNTAQGDKELTDIDDLIDEITKQRPELDKEEILSRIKAKKDAIGANYLTDRGAVFLIASECGITIGKPVKSDVAIKEMYAGAGEVSLEVRVLCVSPIRKYTQKDGGQGALRTITVYDSIEDTASVKLWNDKASLPGINELKPGDFVKITGANIKEERGRGGDDNSSEDTKKPLAIHVGSGSIIEPVDTPQREIPTIQSITKDISDLSETKSESNLVVSGILDGNIQLLEYTRQQTGEQATALKFRMRGENDAGSGSGSGSGSSVRRIVLWGKDMSSVPKKITTASPQVTLIGVSTKITEQQGMEIHGNESTHFEIKGGEGDGNDTIDPITIRILAKPTPTNSSNNTNTRQAILGVDSNAKLYTIIDKDQVSVAYNEGEIIECVPTRIQGRSVTLDSSSYIRSISSESTDEQATAIMPTLKDVLTPILDIKPDGGIYCIGCVLFNAPDMREILTKNGDTIRMAEVGIGDGSGEGVIKAWRNQSTLFEKCNVGDKYIITGIRAQQGMGEGMVDLTLTEYSTITPEASVREETPQ